MICMVFTMILFVYINIIQLFKESKRHTSTMAAIKHKFRQDRDRIRDQYAGKLRSYRSRRRD